jgi:hypothetical protein
MDGSTDVKGKISLVRKKKTWGTCKVPSLPANVRQGTLRQPRPAKEKAKPVPALEFDLIPTVRRWYE